MGPVGAAAREDSAAAIIDAEHGVAFAARIPLVVPMAVVRVPDGGGGGEGKEVVRRAVAAGSGFGIVSVVK